VKVGPERAQQSYEQHSIVEPVGCRSHAGKAPQLDV